MSSPRLCGGGASWRKRGGKLSEHTNKHTNTQGDGLDFEACWKTVIKHCALARPRSHWELLEAREKKWFYVSLKAHAPSSSRWSGARRRTTGRRTLCCRRFLGGSRSPSAARSDSGRGRRARSFCAGPLRCWSGFRSHTTVAAGGGGKC